MTPYTPGPWLPMVGSKSVTIYLGDDDGCPFAEVYGKDREANAKTLAEREAKHDKDRDEWLQSYQKLAGEFTQNQERIVSVMERIESGQERMHSILNKMDFKK